MKFTFAFFNKHKRQREKILLKQSGNYLLSIIICTIITIRYNTIVFATNLVDNVDNNIIKEAILSNNLLLRATSYRYNKVEEKAQSETIDYSSTQEELAMDSVANNYEKNVLVFNNLDNYFCNVISETKNYQKLNVCGVEVVNYSSNRNIDFAKILAMDDIFFEEDDEVTMYTTHTSESYSNCPEYSAPARTLDGRYNMLSIASCFARNLNIKNINTVCSLNPHDYGEYNSAYTNSRITLASIIEENPNVKVAIDVHRDAIEDLSFAPKLDIMGYNVACVMLVMGIGYEDEPNIYYERNLKLAFEIQMLANKIYPGLFRPMIIRDSVYNQDLMANSFLIEVGATGNTIEEAKLSTRCLSNLLNIIYNH